MIESIWYNKEIPVRTVWLPINTYKNLHPIKQVYGVCFTNDKKIMIIRNPLGNGEFTPWYLPGGTPEENETPEKTLIREVDEEADISISNLKMLGTFEVFYSYDPDKKLPSPVYQLRYFAMIDEIGKQTLDPHDNKMVERKLVPAEEVTNYIEWGTVGEALFETAIKEFASLSKD